MKQIAQYQDGRLEIQEVPSPQAFPGGILVRATHSVISPGTEKMKVEQAKMNLLQKARARPDQVKQVLDTARTLGWRSALEKVKNRLESPTPLGYSAAGEVIELAPGNTRFRVGDRVAVGGAECAFHAELLSIPNLLAAKIPHGVENWEGAYATLCSISMQAVRQAKTQVGDRVVVLGQGLVGLLATGILHAAGARVLAVDLDSSRLEVARRMGAERVVDPGDSALTEVVRDWTEGFGADQVLLCIGGSDPKPAEEAWHCLRDRGMLVIVGMYDATLSWKQYYMKEIEVRYSRSYGPGRYDQGYEFGAHDYPIGYVRWTEERNFTACLQLIESGRLKLEHVTTHRVSFESSAAIYGELTSGSAIGVVLEYGGSLEPEGKTIDPESEKKSKPGSTGTGAREVDSQTREPLPAPIEQLNVVGAGHFVRTMLLPHLRDKIRFGLIVNQTALSARHVAEKFGFSKKSTDSSLALGGSKPRAVLVGTRHHLHAPMVLEALKSDHHVFVEKPLCLSREELAEIDRAMERTTGSLMVGFNRRFAPATRQLGRLLGHSPGPKSMAFHVFAGALKPDHWYANHDESGGRVLGEACHFLDFFCYLADGPPVRVLAQTTWPSSGRVPYPDSVTAQVEFADGSSGQLIYSAEGDNAYPKETFKVYSSGLVATMENFRKLEIFHGRKKQKSSFSSKGHREEMENWSDFLKGNAPHPLPFAQSRTSMELTFAVLESIQLGHSVDLD